VFPNSFAGAAIAIGAIWIIQGLGIAKTGSFMDRDPRWAIIGTMLVVGGVATLLVRRRKARVNDEQE
jgi:hypothetical protein